MNFRPWKLKQPAPDKAAALRAALAGRRPAPRAKGATSGHLFSPIG